MCPWLVKSSQSNFDLRSPDCYWVRSYLITTVTIIPIIATIWIRIFIAIIRNLVEFILPWKMPHAFIPFFKIQHVCVFMIVKPFKLETDFVQKLFLNAITYNQRKSFILKYLDKKFIYSEKATKISKKYSILIWRYIQSYFK